MDNFLLSWPNLKHWTACKRHWSHLSLKESLLTQWLFFNNLYDSQCCTVLNSYFKYFFKLCTYFWFWIKLLLLKIYILYSIGHIVYSVYCVLCYMIHRTKKEKWRHRRGPKEEKAKSKEEKTTNAEKDWRKQGIFFNIQVSITSF